MKEVYKSISWSFINCLCTVKTMVKSG